MIFVQRKRERERGEREDGARVFIFLISDFLDGDWLRGLIN
jgi:hypothetical protein